MDGLGSRVGEQETGISENTLKWGEREREREREKEREREREREKEREKEREREIEIERVEGMEWVS